MPPEVDDAYEHILEKAQNRRMATKLFQIVLASPPMHIKVLNVALTLANGRERIKAHEDINNNLYHHDSYGNVLRNLSGLFLVIRNNHVDFIHRTAREFLLINDNAGSRSNRQWKGSLNEEDSHSLMWNICLLFLQLCPDIEVTKPWDKALVLDADGNVISTHSGPHIYVSFVVYAVQNWHKHYRHQSAQAAEQSISDARLCCLKTWKTISSELLLHQHDLEGKVLRSFDGKALSDRRYQEIYAVVALTFYQFFSTCFNMKSSASMK